MKKMSLAFSLMAFAARIFGQDVSAVVKPNSASFPTNVNAQNFNTIAQLDGHLVAFDGTIERLESSRNNTPFYKLRIDSSQYLWTVLMFENTESKVGDTVRVLGYLRPMPSVSERSKKEKYLDGTHVVLAFGLVDVRNSNLLFLGGADKQKQEWIDGKIPSE